ncbi:hypothetical protein SDC9_145535 [bioreactor metagenome]|uniref:Uncharacterized protein n=1 Tax=bioreactor metagenome TaxID=1076179 RepID=A0A645E971_9ZZZZ
MSGQRFPLRPADGAKQHGVARLADANGILRQGNARFVDGTAAHQNPGVGQGKAKPLRRRVQYANRFIDDFGADTVAADDRDVVIHPLHLRYIFPARMAFISPPEAMMP